jgi:hypothetical protein
MHLLIKRGANLKNPQIMKRAVESTGNLTLIQFLHQKGAVLTYKNRNTGTDNLLSKAAQYCKVEIVKFLMDTGHVPFIQPLNTTGCDNQTKEYFNDLNARLINKIHKKGGL